MTKRDPSGRQHVERSAPVNASSGSATATVANPVADAPAPGAASGAGRAPARAAVFDRYWPTLRDALAGTDLRSLAVFRILIALVVLADLAARARTLTVHYTDAGVLPRTVIEPTLARGRWSLLLLNGETWFAVTIFVLAGLAALAMLAGVGTRIATLVTWILLVSIQVRNPGLLSAADSLLRQLLLWSILLPLGERWSLDARWQAGTGHRLRPNAYASLATFGVFLQITFMYWFTAILKDGADWRKDGTALQYTLNAGHLTTRFGAWLGQFGTLLEVLTWLSISLEVFVPILLFLPFRNGPARLVAIVSIVLFQLGIGLTLDIGIFPWTSALCMAIFLPTWFWDVLLPRFWPRRRARPRTSPPTASNPPPGPARLTAASVTSGIVSVFSIGCLAIVLAWNLMTVSDVVFPYSVRPVAYSLGLPQQWNMFAPRPPHVTQWYVLAGTLANGEQVNLTTAITHDDFTRLEAMTWDRPPDIASGWYGTKYWRKYFSAVADDGVEAASQRRALFSYTCTNWNAVHTGGEALTGVAMIVLTEPTRFDEENVPARRAAVGTTTCQ